MVARLILNLNNEPIGEFALDREVIVIGRHPDSDIHIDNLAVSGHHAHITTAAGNSVLKDLGSTNGTFVNSKRVEESSLAPGDVITIGRHRLRYEAAEAAEAEAESSGDDGYAETIVISPDDSATLRKALSETQVARARKADIESGGASVRPGKVAANIGPARLCLLTETGNDKEMALTKALTTMGRPGVQVAAISRRQDGDFIVHVDGGKDDTARPLVNGSAMEMKSRKLVDQDIIEIAGVRLRYLLG